MSIPGPVGIGIGCAMLLLTACTAWFLYEISRAVDIDDNPGPPRCPWCTDQRWALPNDCGCDKACGQVYCMRLAEAEAAR